jgi:hypothetical protein
LVDDPFEGGAVAEAVVEGGGWDAAEGEGFAVAEFGLVFAEGHPFDTECPGLAGLLGGVLGFTLTQEEELKLDSLQIAEIDLKPYWAPARLRKAAS